MLVTRTNILVPKYDVGMNIVAEGYVRENFTLVSEVWTNIYAEGYVRST